MSIPVQVTFQTFILPGTIEKTLLPHIFIPERMLKFDIFLMALQHKAVDVIKTVFQLFFFFFFFNHIREISSSVTMILEGIYTTLLLQQQAALTASSYSLLQDQIKMKMAATHLLYEKGRGL